MLIRTLTTSLITVLGLAAVAGAQEPPMPPTEGAKASQTTTRTTTLDDQTELHVTVYNSDLALVRDVRKLQLPKGIGDLQFMDIAATVNPATVHFRSVTEPSKVRVIEQNYEYDLLDPEKLLQKYVGRDVTLVRQRTENGTTREEMVQARLLSFNGSPVWRIGNDIVTGWQPSSIRYPTLPTTLFTRPTLIWTLENQGGAAHTVEASYLAKQFSWRADYVLTVSRDDARADLDAWVTVVNNSGTTLANATLQLVAGELNRVRDEMYKGRVMAAVPAETVRVGGNLEEAFSEYHLYTLPMKTTLNNKQTKQVSLFSGTGVSVAKRYVVTGQGHYYGGDFGGQPLKDKVEVYYEFKNDEASRLGLPMPAGVVRVYQQDSRGGAQFAGEDRIEHTPKNETITLHIGNAFDIVCERKQTDFRKVASNTYEVEFEVTLRNRKTSAVTVELREPMGGSWKMLSHSHPWTKTSASTALFNVAVPADGTTVVKYRARVTY